MDTNGLQQNMDIAAVDTSKFESWPLLRPDELEAMPTEVLQASAADLDLLCLQGSGRDPVNDYAQIQRERTTTILLERAAQASVQALLAGTEFVGRDSLVNSSAPPTRPPEARNAPSHDAWSMKRPLNDDHARYAASYARDSNPNGTLAAPFGQRSTSYDDESKAKQSVRSPRRLQTSSRQSPFPPFSPAATLGGKRQTDIERSLLCNENGANWAKGAGGMEIHHSLGRNGHEPPPPARDAADAMGSWTSPPACAVGAAGKTIYRQDDESNDRDVNGTLKLTAADGAGAKHAGRKGSTGLHWYSSGAPTANATVTQRHGSNHGAQSASSDVSSAVRDNWGSVFIVAGGQRRRRRVARQRSVIADDSLAARRAQVEKERQERRKASLRRLMARKEQRALQQEARRKRRAIEAKTAAAAAAAAARSTSVAPACAAPCPQSHEFGGAYPRLAEASQEGVEGAGKRGGSPGTGQLKIETIRGKRNLQSQGSTREGFVGDRESVVEASEQNSHQQHLDPHQHPPVEGSEVGLDGGRNHVSASATNVTNVSMADNKVDGSSSGSESESVSGGGSSDNDELSIDQIEDEEEVEEEATPKGLTSTSVGASSRNATDQAGGKLGQDLARKTTIQHASPCDRDGSGGGSSRDGEHVNGIVGCSEHRCQGPPTQARGPDIDGAKANPAEDGAKEDDVLVIATRRGAVPDKGLLGAPRSHESRDPDPCDYFSADTNISGTHQLRQHKAIVDMPNKVVGFDEACKENENPPQQQVAVEVAAPAVSASPEINVCLSDAPAGTPPDSSADGRIEGNMVDDCGPDDWEENGGQEYDASEGDCGYDSEGSKGALELPGPLDVQPIAGIFEAGTEPALETSGSKVFIGETRQLFTCRGVEQTQNWPSQLAPAGRSLTCCSDADIYGALSLSASESASPRSPEPPVSTDRCCSSDCRRGAEVTTTVPDQPLQEPLAMIRQPSEAHRERAGGRSQKKDITKEEANDSRKTMEPHRKAEMIGRRDPVINPHSARSGVEGSNVGRVCAKSTVESHHAFTAAPQGRRQRRNRSSMLSSPAPSAGAGEGSSNDADFEIEGSEIRGGVGPGRTKPGGSKMARNAPGRSSLARYTDYFPWFAAILSAYHNGRALTRQADCRSLPLTSTIMSREKAGSGSRGVAATSRRGVKGSGLTAVEEAACFHRQWKLYAIYVRVIKDYAAVFSYGDSWSANGTADDSNSNSLVYTGDSSALHYRVNSKARPEVYNIVTDVLNNRCEQWEELPTGLGLKTTWNLLWTWSKPHIEYSSLLTWQKVNHFPNSRELTRKDLLNKNLSRFMAPGGRLAKEFRIMPQTFVLPHEFTLFVSAFNTSSPSGHSKHERRDTSRAWRKDGIDVRFSTEKEEENNTKKDRGGPSTRGNGNNLWIMKPVGMSRGRGIRLIDDIKNICYADKVVLQRYIGNPLLLDGYKFDLRLYVLVTSFNKLEAFIYKEGFARLSTHLYEKGHIDNRFMHITNSSIQRLNEAGASRDSPLYQAKTSEAGGTKTTLSYLWRRLAASGADVGGLWARICSVVVKSLVCVEASIPNQPNSFELFGYDVLIDDRLRPWLIEVNSSPSMARETHVDRQVKEALIFETVHLIDPLPFDRQKLVDILGRRLLETERSKMRMFSQHPHPHRQQHFDTSEVREDAGRCGAGDNSVSSPSARGPAIGEQKQRPRRTKEEAELERDLDEILRGRRPRKVGETPARMGNFVRLCPGTAAYRHARRLRRKVIRPQPGDDDEPMASNR